MQQFVSFAVSGKQGKYCKSQREKWRVYRCVCAGVRAKSEVALMNESETKRGNAHRLLSLSLQLPLISVRVSKQSHHQSLVETQWRAHMGRISELEDPITKHRDDHRDLVEHMMQSFIEVCKRVFFHYFL